MIVDMGVIDALRLYVLHGLNPGSFGEALLIGDKERTFVLCHPHLLTVDEGMNQTIVDNMILFVDKIVPDFAKGSREVVKEWERHHGLDRAPDQYKVLMALDEKWKIWQKGTVKQLEYYLME